MRITRDPNARPMPSAADDLRKPLRRHQSGPRSGGLRIAPFPILAGAAALAGVMLIGWISVHEDPLGGEPQAIVKLEPVEALTTSSAAPADLPLKPAPEAGQDAARPEAVAPQEVGRAEDAAPRREAASLAVPRKALVAAPVKGLTEKSAHGLLPRIGGDGRTPAQVYARPAPASAGKPQRIALLIGGLGLSRETTERAIYRLPDEITLAFAPYGGDLQRWIGAARADGHEVMLQLPMEPFGYPTTDPGPKTMLVGAAAAENIDRLHWFLARFSGYAGVTNYMGGKFATDAAALRPVLGELRARGLLFLEEGPAGRNVAGDVARELGLAHRRGDLVIDAEVSAEAIETALQQLEDLAARNGAAVGIGTAFPQTLQALEPWIDSLPSRGVTLAPVTALFRAAAGGTAVP